MKKNIGKLGINREGVYNIELWKNSVKCPGTRFGANNILISFVRDLTDFFRMSFLFARIDFPNI